MKVAQERPALTYDMLDYMALALAWEIEDPVERSWAGGAHRKIPPDASIRWALTHLPASGQRNATTPPMSSAT